MSRRLKLSWGRLTAIGVAVLAGLAIVAVAGPAMAQSFSVDLGDNTGSTTARIAQIIVMMTVITLAPSLLLMVTSFTRLVIVFSILRSAMGTNTTPPSQVVIGLSLFMTLFIMQPTLEKAWEAGITPLVNEQVDEFEAFELASAPFRDFMLKHVRDKDLQLFLDMGQIDTVENPEATPMRALVPAFMISELRRAFEIGFLIYLPFVVIDMVIASVLMSMGMMMLPPMMLAMPFKLIFFVLIDGWHLLVGSLVQSYGIIG